jgi:hypothetical protein
MDFEISIGFMALYVEGWVLALEYTWKDVAAVVLYVDDLQIIANMGLAGLVKEEIKK